MPKQESYSGTLIPERPSTSCFSLSEIFILLVAIAIAKGKALG